MCKNGEWITVTVDDYFPCQPLGGPIFSSNAQPELWVLLLEKAYAKIHGSYMQLQVGDGKDVILDLTGCPGESFCFSDGDCCEIIKDSQDQGYMVTAFTVYLNDSKGVVDYPITQLKQLNGVQLINLRNICGSFEWKGDWSKGSQLWTEDLKKEVDYSQSDGDFWMTYEDLTINFQGINIYKTRNWEEVRIKGKFVTVQDHGDDNIEALLSKWYYSFEVQQNTKINIGVHQEDVKIFGAREKRPYLDLGVAVFRRSADSDLIMVKITPLMNQRQIQCELLLPPGQYLILPRTNICSMHLSQLGRVSLLDEKQNLSPLTISTIQDIFKKFDMLLANELTYVEFKGFVESIQRKIQQKEFQITILKKYQSTDRGITLNGFMEFFRDQIIDHGEEIVFQWLALLGYDGCLNSLISRTFILTIHSDAEIQVGVRDALQTDLDHRSTTMFTLNNQIEHHVSQQGIRVFYSFNENSLTYSYLVHNDLMQPILIKFDCSQSKGVRFSVKGGKITKKVESNRMDFLMHVRMADNTSPLISLQWNIIK